MLGGSHTTILASDLRPAFFRTVLSSMLAGLGLVGVDALVREGWPYISAAQHWRWALLLYVAAGAAAGIVAQALQSLEARWSGGRPIRQRAGFYAAIGGGLLATTARAAFSGEAISVTRWGQLGPALAILAGAAACYGAACLVLQACAYVDRGEVASGVFVGLLAGGVGLELARLDLTQFVALYPRLHVTLEVAAWLALGVGFQLLLRALERRSGGVRRGVSVLSLAGIACLLLLGASSGARARLEGALRHTFLEEVYVGRMLRRLQLAEAFVADPRGFRSLSWSRLQLLRKRSGFTVLRQDARWSSSPPPLDSEQQAALWALRDPLRRYNIIVYYVDTLRADVAADPRVMPSVARFAQTAVQFPRAYSAGSDTLRSLPALTGGDYDILSTPDNDVLRLARRAGYESTLLIPQSAEYFLAKLRPEFRFDRTVSITDHPKSREVWGYGADQPTAARLVDRALSFLDEPRRERRPFLLWLFNFDVHNWRELEQAHVDDAVQRFGIKEDPAALPYRYRAVAAALDAEFGRMLHGLQRRKLLDNTVILFVSDHGEALGRDGFWVHSVFLWESLVRVPLLLKAPGLAPRSVDEPVSLVDVAPTLARYMFPHAPLDGYAGEDLLTRLLAAPQPRRLPILLVSASRDVLVRVGLVAPEQDCKLVLSLEAGLPELYDLRAADPDATNVSDAHPQLTRRLLRDLMASPVFPRSLWDFDVRDTKEQRAAVGIPADP